MSKDECEYEKFEMKLAQVVARAINLEKGNELKDSIKDTLSCFAEILDRLKKSEQCIESLYDVLKEQEWVPENNKPPFNEDVIGTDDMSVFPCKYTMKCASISSCDGWHTPDGYCISGVTLWKKMPLPPSRGYTFTKEKIL